MLRNHIDDDELGYGAMNRTPEDRENVLWVGKPYLKLPANWGNGTMIALSAKTREIVDAFYVAALANGGTDEGAPGLRPYHANFYACYVRDPDGNKLSVVCESA
jgi:catechol 2,3-dioxygenase-like lactoylglutathione lyase family enzyme